MTEKLPEYFDPIAGQINVRLLATKRVAIIGLGAVGAPIAADLAKAGVGGFLLIDGDVYKERNRSRHPLGPNHRDENKATAMRQHLLALEVPVPKHVNALPHNVDEPLTDAELDALLDPADLIVAATGEREVQRRIARRALALDIPVVLPSLYLAGGGEVFIQTSPRHPCFLCLDGSRLSTEPVRGAEALPVDLTPVIATAIELSYCVLDPESRYGSVTIPKHDESDRRLYQHFVLFREAPRRRFAISHQEDCPSCAVGPSPLRPDALRAWQEAQRIRSTGTSSSPPAPPPAGGPSTPSPEHFPFPPSTRPTPTPPLTPARPKTGPTAGWVIVGLLVAAWLLISLVLLIAESGHSTKKPLPPPTPKQVAATEMSTAKARIAEMSLMCIAGAVCRTDPVGHAVPVFIYALDQNLQFYLEDHGYTDSWSDNAGFVSGHVLHPADQENEVSFMRYSENISSFTTEPERVQKEPASESGLIYKPPNSSEPGLTPPRMLSNNRPWVITWRLRGPSGQVVKELHYTLTLMSCPESNPEAGVCGQTVKEQEQREHEWAHEEHNKYYTPPPPPLFPNM